MKKRDEQAFKHFLAAYKHQWDLNKEARDAYDEDLEYYVGYRNESDYPNAYNMTFPQLLPRIMTMLARMLGQIYQGNSNYSITPSTMIMIHLPPSPSFTQ